jgi:hypothetical protein
MHAANNGHTAAAKALVECGADPEATDDNGYTALMVAVFSDRCVWCVCVGGGGWVVCGWLGTVEEWASAELVGGSWLNHVGGLPRRLFGLCG